jgi:hypothetical protein
VNDLVLLKSQARMIKPEKQAHFVILKEETDNLLKKRKKLISCRFSRENSVRTFPYLIDSFSSFVFFSLKK